MNDFDTTTNKFSNPFYKTIDDELHHWEQRLMEELAEELEAWDLDPSNDYQ